MFAHRKRVSLLDKFSSRLIHYMASHADYLCMESDSVKKEWPELKHNSIRCIHLYTETGNFNPIEERKEVLGMVCRLTPGKHIIECIQAMVSIHETYSSWRLEIIGSGVQQYECEQEINKLGASGYISLLGWVEHKEVRSRVKTWSFLLYPTDMEGMPNGLLEMMGYGIPALVSYVGGIRDVVVDEKNGFVLSDNSKESIESGILRMIKMTNMDYERCSKEAYITIARKYSIDGARQNARSIIGA